MRSFLNWLVDHVLVHVPGLGRLLRGMGREETQPDDDDRESARDNIEQMRAHAESVARLNRRIHRDR